MKFWHAVALVNLGRVNAALPLFQHIFAKGANWVQLPSRLIEAVILDADERILDRILSQAPESALPSPKMSEEVPSAMPQGEDR